MDETGAVEAIEIENHEMTHFAGVEARLNLNQGSFLSNMSTNSCVISHTKFARTLVYALLIVTSIPFIAGAAFTSIFIEDGNYNAAIVAFFTGHLASSYASFPWQTLPTQSWGRGGLQVRNPIPLKIRHVWGLLHVKIARNGQTPLFRLSVRKFGVGGATQVSFSSSDRGSKLRGPSQNSHRVASKRDVHITKLNQYNPVSLAL
ncbi:hypothetical protein AVEN_149617-1 [Araneus ventricosus]|uniref:Uncharacterized protein n=1 Tax=Araneus ventricosus TaxID=182803 RepID=A0A4Y2IZI5_ARAVE|nr:hypothetical protein AVEN_149617-1 [Araneus ventricosus]